MRRILLIAAMLLLPISSAMAAVTITATPGAQHDIAGVAHKYVTITYSSGVDVRAFALDINVSTGMSIGDSNLTGFKVGESNAVSPGYGIFPGRFRDFINPSSPNWQDSQYSPLAPWADAPNSGLGWPSMIVELGALYSGDPNKPALTGTLFTFDVNSEGNAGGVLKVDTEALRGAIVGADGTALADNLPIWVNLGITQGCTVPNCVGITREACKAAILLAGLPIGTEVNVPGTGQAMRQVIAQSPAGGSVVDCATPVGFSAVSWPMKPGANLPGGAAGSLYANWLLRGRPACWAYPRQCRGDVDGKIQGLYWVASSDLNYWKSANGKTAANLPSIPGGICADFDHKIQGLYWVASSDLNIWKSFNGKTAANVPMCGNIPSASSPPSADPNYHYWCLPSTGGTCPAGQYCAPAGVCPNSL